MKRKGTLAVLLVLVLFPGSVPTALAAEGNPPWHDSYPGAIRGQVIRITGHTLTVRTPRGEVHMVTSENTIFRIPAVEDASIEDISLGDTVVALGWWSGEKSAEAGPPPFHARLVAVVPPGARWGGVAGQVKAVEGSNILVSTRGGETAIVRTDAKTTFRIVDVKDPGLDDIHEGTLIGAAGTWNDDGTIQARVVTVPRGVKRHGRLVGQCAAISGTNLTLRFERGRETVLLTDRETAFVVPGVEHATLTDVAVGDRVVAVVQTQEGRLYAQTVGVLPEQPALVTGRVNTIEGSDLLLETRQGHVRVLSSGDTLLRIPGVENPTLDDLNTGDVVVCGGSWEDHATFRALAVLVRVGSQWRGLPPTILGRPTAVGTNHLAASTTHGLSSYQAAIWSDCEQVLS